MPKWGGEVVGGRSRETFEQIPIMVISAQRGRIRSGTHAAATWTSVYCKSFIPIAPSSHSRKPGRGGSRPAVPGSPDYNS
jgi:hypothetical protein